MATLSIKGTKFYLNNALTYDEIKNCPDHMKGTLLNARFIQGIFDTSINREQFNRFGRNFDPEKNTDDLIHALPEWYSYGMRAFTVGLQGGGPCFTNSENLPFINNPYEENGTKLNEQYKKRLLKLIAAANDLNMVVIVSLFYTMHYKYLGSEEAIKNAVITVSHCLKESGYHNIIIEIANEQNLKEFEPSPLLHTDEGICSLIQLAKTESGGMPVGCSGSGDYYSEAIGKTSDVILVHGNGLLYDGILSMIQRIKQSASDKPIVFNEDSPAYYNLVACAKESVSWGYYNNITKQEPPTDWTIQHNEDLYFAYYMAKSVGINVPEPKEEFIFCGLSRNERFNGHAWPRVACLHPDEIASITYYRDGTLLDCMKKQPFVMNEKWIWLWRGVTNVQPGEVWKAVIEKKNGQVCTLQAISE